MTDAIDKERRILRAMRKTLAGVVRDLTPNDHMQAYPLSDTTVEDVKMCFDLIAARERELAEIAGVRTMEKPRYVDEPKAAQPIAFHKPAKS